MIKELDIFKDNQNKCYQLRTKSNLFTIEFDDKEKEEIFLKIINEIKNEPMLTLKGLRSKIQTDENKAKVIEVLGNLNEYGLLPVELRTKFKIEQFFPDKKQIKDITFTIFGQDALADKLKIQAKKEGYKKVKQYSYDIETTDMESIIKNSDFLIVDANEWSPFYIEMINQIALKYNKPWLYIMGVYEGSLKIGPLFYGRETGCYNCLISRIKSNHEHPRFFESYELYLRGKKQKSKPDIIPGSDILYNIIANISMLEVMKFFEEWSLPVTWRAIIDIDIFTLELTKHILLKKPYCEVCKPELEYAISPWLEPITLK